MNLPPLNSHNHPDFPSMKWTQLEMDAIKKYGELCIKEYKASISKRLGPQRGHTPDIPPEAVAEIRKMIAEYKIGYKAVNQKFPMSESTFRSIKGHRGAYK